MCIRVLTLILYSVTTMEVVSNAFKQETGLQSITRHLPTLVHSYHPTINRLLFNNHHHYFSAILLLPQLYPISLYIVFKLCNIPNYSYLLLVLWSIAKIAWVLRQVIKIEI